MTYKEFPVSFHTSFLGNSFSYNHSPLNLGHERWFNRLRERKGITAAFKIGEEELTLYIPIDLLAKIAVIIVAFYIFAISFSLKTLMQKKPINDTLLRIIALLYYIIPFVTIFLLLFVLCIQ